MCVCVCVCVCVRVRASVCLSVCLSANEENKTVIVKMRQLKLEKDLHRLPWRSQEFLKIIASLGGKLEQRRSDHAQALCLEAMVGLDSQREVSSNTPE